MLLCEFGCGPKCLRFRSVAQECACSLVGASCCLAKTLVLRSLRWVEECNRSSMVLPETLCLAQGREKIETWSSGSEDDWSIVLWRRKRSGCMWHSSNCRDLIQTESSAAFTQPTLLSIHHSKTLVKRLWCGPPLHPSISLWSWFQTHQQTSSLQLLPASSRTTTYLML